MRDTCCPQYTIRLDAGAFAPTKNQRGVVNRFNRFLQTGHRPGEGGEEAGGKQGGGKAKGKGKAKPFDLVEELRLHQVGYGTGESKHKFEVGSWSAARSSPTSLSSCPPSPRTRRSRCTSDTRWPCTTTGRARTR